jgi:hypothetical protein
MGKRYLKSEAVKKVRRHSKVNQHKKFKKRNILPDFEFLDTQKSHNCQKLCSGRSYKYYRSKSKQKKRLSEVTLHKVFNMFLKELRLQMLNNEMGVFIENFGYFGIIRSPINTRTEKTPFPKKNIRTAGERYRPIFLPIRKASDMNLYVMDKSFHPSVYKGIENRLYKDREWKFAYTLLHNLYGRDNYKINPPIPKLCC